MKKKFLSVLLLIAPIVTFAQEKGLDQKIDEAFGNVLFRRFFLSNHFFIGGVKSHLLVLLVLECNIFYHLFQIYQFQDILENNFYQYCQR